MNDYRIIEYNLQDIKKMQNEIRLNLNDSIYCKIFLHARNLFRKVRGREILSVIQLYNKQLENISILNKILGENINKSKPELEYLDGKINKLYQNLINNSGMAAILEKEENHLHSELENLICLNNKNDNRLIYKMSFKKSSIERKLATNKNRLSLIKNYSEYIPREISLFESQQKLLHNTLSRCEYLFQKSMHIEVILSNSLSGIKSISSKKELLKRLSIAFSELEEYVINLADYSAREMLNSAGSLLEADFRLSLSIDNSIANLENLTIMGEI